MIFQIDPLRDLRWERFVQRHPSASVFHTTGWLSALRNTYGYDPVVLTTSSPEEDLANALVFCRVSSWVTGKRLVSLPFSDHCDPLIDDANGGSELFEGLRKEQQTRSLKAIELRPRYFIPNSQSSLEATKSYCFHSIDLMRDEKTLFSGFHKDCVQRKIQRADREKLTYREDCSGEFLKSFYQLLVRTRKRHGVPPQPFRWFQNLAECLGPSLQIRTAWHGDRLAAAIVTLKFRDSLVYKYGCSEPALNNLGGTPWLFWKAIQEAKGQGINELDLGRSDWDNPGLIAFKDRLGGKRLSINYWQYSKAARHPRPSDLLRRPAEWILARSPQSILIVAGRLLYRHLG